MILYIGEEGRKLNQEQAPVDVEALLAPFTSTHSEKGQGRLVAIPTLRYTDVEGADKRTPCPPPRERQVMGETAVDAAHRAQTSGRPYYGRGWVGGRDSRVSPAKRR